MSEDSCLAPVADTGGFCFHQDNQSQTSCPVEDRCEPGSCSVQDNSVRESCSLRTLTSDEQELLQKQNSRMISEFKQMKLQSEARKHWDIFYKRNSSKFFKDRHWIFKEFDDLLSELEATGPWTLLEAGCGVGNFLFPLLEQTDRCFVYCCDFSPRAVEMVKLNPLYNIQRCSAFECDLAGGHLIDTVRNLDVATLVFVLSAVPPTRMMDVLKNIHQALKPGGLLLFRDYGMYDHAMLRFAPGKKLQQNCYVRQDCTLAYYFSLEELQELLVGAGFRVRGVKYLLSETVNKKKELSVPRVFVQATAVKEV